jgi:hypothetical protein
MVWPKLTEPCGTSWRTCWPNSGLGAAEFFHTAVNGAPPVSILKLGTKNAAIICHSQAQSESADFSTRAPTASATLPGCDESAGRSPVWPAVALITAANSIPDFGCGLSLSPNLSCSGEQRGSTSNAQRPTPNAQRPTPNAQWKMARDLTLSFSAVRMLVKKILISFPDQSTTRSLIRRSTLGVEMPFF